MILNRFYLARRGQELNEAMVQEENRERGRQHKNLREGYQMGPKKNGNNV